MIVTTMASDDDCCPHWTACLHCPECGDEVVFHDDAYQGGETPVRYDGDADTHYLQCPQGHRYWFRDKT